eukprot:CAMPEP_0184698574 /NCGR_PEP_ID=MMETSP0313-20130426/5153_1 /TAXON_ID=2792 /ORGANISM="Porphyridium aerugineum, Strain SAG 1380-2" /LENGTH=499 /DNA_ID=CAMNT_0027157537 /DNA_START=512 /DNA_END=2011 /DNA_ORIENTATION=+
MPLRSILMGNSSNRASGERDKEKDKRKVTIQVEGISNNNSSSSNTNTSMNKADDAQAEGGSSTEPRLSKAGTVNYGSTSYLFREILVRRLSAPSRMQTAPFLRASPPSSAEVRINAGINGIESNYTFAQEIENMNFSRNMSISDSVKSVHSTQSLPRLLSLPLDRYAENVDSAESDFHDMMMEIPVDQYISPGMRKFSPHNPSHDSETISRADFSRVNILDRSAKLGGLNVNVSGDGLFSSSVHGIKAFAFPSPKTSIGPDTNTYPLERTRPNSHTSNDTSFPSAHVNTNPHTQQVMPKLQELSSAGAVVGKPPSLPGVLAFVNQDSSSKESSSGTFESSMFMSGLSQFPETPQPVDQGANVGLGEFDSAAFNSVNGDIHESTTTIRRTTRHLESFYIVPEDLMKSWRVAEKEHNTRYAWLATRNENESRAPCGESTPLAVPSAVLIGNNSSPPNPSMPRNSRPPIRPKDKPREVKQPISVTPQLVTIQDGELVEINTT